MRVALVQSTPLPPSEGIGNHVVHLARELRDSGHDVELFTRGSWTGSNGTVEEFPVHRPACPPLYPLHAHLHRFPLQRAIRRAGPFDVVHLHSPLVPLPNVEAPTVATVHTPIGQDVDSVPSDAPGQRLLQLQVPFSEHVEGTLVDGSTAVTTVSGSIQTLLEDTHDRSTSVVNNGVTASEFEPRYDDRDDDTLLYVGRLGRRKGLPRLIDVAERLKERDVDFTLNVAGKGPLEDDIRERVAGGGLEDRVNLLGFVDRDRLYELLASTAVFVHLPEFEGLPTTVLEAMASGAPVVATDVPGCRDAVVHEETGLLVEKDHVGEIATAVASLLDDPDRRRSYGRNARQLVEERFDWSRIASEYEAVYQEVA